MEQIYKPMIGDHQTDKCSTAILNVMFRRLVPKSIRHKCYNSILTYI